MLRSAILILCAARILVHGVQFTGHGEETIFPGPWEIYNKAPNGRTIRPVKVYDSDGDVVNPDGLIKGKSTTLKPGGGVTYEFKENIAGKVYWKIDPESSLSKNYTDKFKLSFGLSESPDFIGRHSDATQDEVVFDNPLQVEIKKGEGSFSKIHIRGAFKYLTIWIDAKDDVVGEPPSFILSDLWVDYRAMPHWPNPQAYTGYFYSSDNLLNRIWYAGAYTLQITTIDPKEGGSLIDFNRRVDGNRLPRGSWASNFTISNGTSVTTDGAKRDRMVYAGDMTIAVPGIAVSTYDLDSIKNALETIFAHQYSSWELPYAGPPMGFHHEFSDTYHLHALLGVWNYVHYSGDVAWLARYWNQYKRALSISTRKVNRYKGLFWATSTADWLRPGQGGFNSEANAIFYLTVKKSIALAKVLGEGYTSLWEIERWSEILNQIESNYEYFWNEEKGLFKDNLDNRQNVLPQDGNSWSIFADGLVSKERAKIISKNLKKRWNKYGAPSVELPNTNSPFASSFELIAHSYAGEYDTALELIRRMWGYLLDGKGFTNSTFAEGFTLDGNIKYPAYWSSARNSHAHGWSTGPTYVLSTEILGIKLIEPEGYSWKIEPHFVDLESVEGGYATRLGKFVVKWKKGGKLHVETPEGTNGHVIWDGETRAIQGGGVWTWDEDGWRKGVPSTHSPQIIFYKPQPHKQKESFENFRSRINGQQAILS